MSDASDELVLYEVVEDSIATITLNRPDKANAQTAEMLDQLDACWTRAARDRDVRVIIVQANGKHFSSGHDISGSTKKDSTSTSDGDSAAPSKITLQSIYEWETIRYIGYSRRWRDVPKPSIAAVQGQCIAGGLMLCWPCDLIIAADNAKFSDPVVRMGIGGVEYHGHTWEVGPRKAKEWLFTASTFTAADAERLGMVNRVVPLDDLRSETLELARQIAKMHPFALAQAKRAVNQTMDIQGFYAALQAVFDVHQTGHGNALSVSGYPILVDLDQMKAAVKSS